MWQVFAHRGMGYFAGAVDGDDTEPVAELRQPPAGHRPATITGTVTDADTGDPVPGVTVTLVFQGRRGGQPDDEDRCAEAHYSLGPVPRGRLPQAPGSMAPAYPSARSR